MKDNISITIITSTLNCANDLIETCDSIRNQSNKNFEWIVIDGNSTDGTLDVIKSNQDIIANWITEPDSGIYDAWNKACKFIQGEWVIFLGAGDKFYSSSTLDNMLGMMAGLTDDVVISYGNVYQYFNNKVIYEYGRVDLEQWDDYRPKLPAHQGVFHRAAILNKPKPFDDTYRIVADSKLLLLALVEGDARYFDIDVCRMLPGGVSSRDDRASIVRNEFLRLEQDVGYRIPLLRKSKYALTVFVKSLALNVAEPGLIVILRKVKRKLNFKS